MLHTRNQVKKLDISNIIDIKAGKSHILALSIDGKVYGWGGND